MHSTDWHDKRREGLGGSDVEAMFGLSRFTTPAELWAQKLGFLPPSEGSAATERGTILEPVVLGLAAQRLARGAQVEPVAQFVQHPRWDNGVRLLANMDAVVAIHDRYRRCVAEAKTTKAGGWVAWQVHQRKPLASWVLQVHHYAACHGLEYAYIAVLVGPSDDPDEWTTGNTKLTLFGMAIDPELVALIEQWAVEFWRYVEAGEEPAPLATSEQRLVERLVEERQARAEVL